MTNHEHLIEEIRTKANAAIVLSKDDFFVDNTLNPWWCDHNKEGYCPMRDICKAYYDDEDCICDWNRFSVVVRTIMWLEANHEI